MVDVSISFDLCSLTKILLCTVSTSVVYIYESVVGKGALQNALLGANPLCFKVLSVRKIEFVFVLFVSFPLC